MRIHDITRSITPETPTYPGDPPIVIERLHDISDGDLFTLSSVSFGSHVGTHIDAPSHLLEGGMVVDEIPLDVLIGEAVVVEADLESGVSAEELERLAIPPRTRRLLVRTPKNVERYLTEDAARWLIHRGMGLVGIDCQSVDGAGSEDMTVHRTLLEAGVVIVENLELRRVHPARYTLVCLPMKLAGLDGAPVRAVLIEKSEVV